MATKTKVNKNAKRIGMMIDLIKKIEVTLRRKEKAGSISEVCLKELRDNAANAKAIAERYRDDIDNVTEEDIDNLLDDEIGEILLHPAFVGNKVLNQLIAECDAQGNFL